MSEDRFLEQALRGEAAEMELSAETFGRIQARARKRLIANAMVSGAAVVIAVVGFLLAASPADQPQDPRPPANTPVEESPDDERSPEDPRLDRLPADPWTDLASGWTRLDPPPFAEDSPAVVWTDFGLFVWGHLDDEGSGMSEGAIYRPQESRWVRIADHQLEPRDQSAVVWTGEQVLLWGGSVASEYFADGAMYDPAFDTWELLPQAPLSDRAPGAYVWTGEEFIVWGTTELGVVAVDGAAYNPRSGTWRQIADAPVVLNAMDSVWTGEEMIVFGSDLDSNNRSKTDNAVGIAYDPSEDSWRELPPGSLSPQASAVSWIGGRMLAWDYELSAELYDPGTDSWRRAESLPIDFMECYPADAVVSGRVLGWFCGEAALYEPAEDAWNRIQTPSTLEDPIHGEPVAADAVVAFAGASYQYEGNALWVFKPPGR